eukprot:CAMPEP_0179886250 /NCGR_PEP_ID=MMETSP0982-20121206/30739_1 /TAXON_ID=483367 /ORGANISM="non described non described, Strain CCMP 2436" /LENGTH=104 /DNA_ID=CAMNT_0021781935 /DNA_START=8 /DNA_END=320 /DNA_ORIENTATION=-
MAAGLRLRVEASSSAAKEEGHSSTSAPAPAASELARSSELRGGVHLSSGGAASATAREREASSDARSGSRPQATLPLLSSVRTCRSRAGLVLASSARASSRGSE